MKWLSTVFGGSPIGGKKMAALTAGTHAPAFELPAMDGSKFSLQEALSRGPVLAIFFKISCPVCQYAFPYFERIHKTYGGPKVSIIGVSQNDKQDTAAFLKTYGITFPVLLDDTKTYPASNAYGLTNVPTAFWISEDGKIEISSVGWARQEFEEIARKAASATGDTPQPVFQPTEQIADFRAG
jgi:peroxiredoxin